MQTMLPEVGRAGARPGWHALAWAWWALAALVALQLAPSPAYVVLMIGVATLVVGARGTSSPLARAYPVLLAVAAVFMGLRVLLTVLTSHAGEPIVLLPQITLPRVLGGLTVGGPVALETLLRATSDGLVVVGVVAVCAAFNAVVAHDELVHAAPRAFHEFGLIVTVALAFVPSTLATITAVREAERARAGPDHRPARWRAGRLIRLVVPVLEGGMERAMTLAESMDARGFARGGATRAERRAGWLSLAALVVLAAAFAALIGRARPLAFVLAMAGALGLLAAGVAASRAAPRPRYRPRRLVGSDLAMMAIAAVPPVGLALLAAAAGDGLRWDPGRSPVPPFDPVAGVLLLMLAAPALPWPALGRAHR